MSEMRIDLLDVDACVTVLNVSVLTLNVSHLCDLMFSGLTSPQGEETNTSR